MAFKTNRFVEQNSHLYLNEEHSDVTIVIQGVPLPAHRFILAKRSEYFKTMFESGMIESTSNRIEIHETSYLSFKCILKWIYTGNLDFSLLSDDYEVLRLAHMYQITELVSYFIDYFKRHCTADRVCTILNEAVLLSLEDLQDFLFEFLSLLPWKNLRHENVEILSTDALNMMLKRGVTAGPSFSIFDAVLGWMKANPSKSTDFPSVLKNVVFDTFSLEELEKADIVDATVLADLAYQQNVEKRIPAYQTPDENVFLAKYGFKTISSDDKKVFIKDVNVLEHRTEEGILIDLGRPFLLNSIKMQISNDHSYWIAVSKDNINWTRVIDHSKYKCIRLQNLFFKERFIRFIQICGTAPVKTDFLISKFEALYTTEPFQVDPTTTLIVPSNAITLVRNDVPLSADHASPNSLIVNSYSEDRPFATFSRGVIVRLPQPYLVDTMKLLLFENGVYNYTIEISVDGVKWTPVITEENVAGWRDINFDRQPVVFVKLTDTCATSRAFDCVHLECAAKD